MQTIGERLEEARKKKGISIREAAEATKIRGDYLGKFENNQFDINLTELYVRGFLRTYAQFLRLPVDRILNDYAALGRGENRHRQPSREIYGRMDVSIASATDERTESASAGPDEGPSPAQTPRRGPAVTRRPASTAGGSNLDPALVFKVVKFAGIAAVVILIVWGALSLFTGGTGEKPKPAPAATTSNAATAAQPGERTVTLVALDTVSVSVTTVADGRVLLPETTLVRGQSQIVPRPGPIYITYSEGRNLELEVYGRRHKMPTTGRDRIKVE